jgi:hypothetical protein
VLAQVQIAAKSNEIPAFAPLLEQVKTVLGSLDAVLGVADALHAQVGHADLLTGGGAHLMVTIKANQRALHDQVKGLPGARPRRGADPRNRSRPQRDPDGQGAHRPNPGRAGIRPRRAGRPDHPHPDDQGKTSREAAYLTVSLPAGQARPVDLGMWARSERHIENRLHCVRDVTLRPWPAWRCRDRRTPWLHRIPSTHESFDRRLGPRLTMALSSVA